MSNKNINPYLYPGLRISNVVRNEIKRKTKSFRFGLTKEEILRIIAEENSVNVEDILTRSRKKELVNARHTYSSILKRYYGYTYVRIADIMKKDHTTIIHSVDTFRTRYINEEDYRHIAHKIYNRIGIQTF